MAFQELGGQGRSAAYNAGRQFTTASTYKLYVAYSTLRRVDNGSYKWSDQISGGRDLAKCFDDMIVLSDNPCAQTLVRKIGYSAVHHDVQATRVWAAEAAVNLAVHRVMESGYRRATGAPLPTARDE